MEESGANIFVLFDYFEYELVIQLAMSLMVTLCGNKHGTIDNNKLMIGNNHVMIGNIHVTVCM